MLFSLLTQLALGWWLSQDDFGVYALAASCTTLLQVFRDGGVQIWLARQDVRQYHANAAPAFWLSLVASLAVAAALILISPLAGHVYASADVTRLIILLGFATPVQALSVVPDAGLQVEMRFRDLALARTVGGAFRYGLTIILALVGFGPYSFVWPLFAAGIAQAAISFAKMGLRPTSLKFSLASSKAVLGGSAWAMTGAFASAIFRQIDYLLLGLIAPVGIVGIYFFAYQLSMQPGLLLSQNIRKVFVPAFAAAGDDARRQHRAVIQTASFLGLIVSPLILYFALVCDGVEGLLWKGRWAAAVPAIRFLSAAVPVHLFSLFSRILIQSAGEFRIWTIVVAVRGACIGLAVLASALIGGSENAAVVAACVAVMIAVSGLVEAVTMLRHLRLPASAAVRAFLAPYSLTAVAAAIALSLPRWAGPLPEPHRLAAISLVFMALTSLGFATMFRSYLGGLLAVLRRLPPQRAN